MVSEQVRHKPRGLYSHRRWIETGNLGFRKSRNCTIHVAKTKALISFAVTALWFRICKCYTKYKSNTNCIWQRITKTCPCNIQRFFSAVKCKNYIAKCLKFLVFLLKTYIVGTRYNGLGEPALTSTHNVCFESKIKKI